MANNQLFEQLLGPISPIAKDARDDDSVSLRHLQQENTGYTAQSRPRAAFGAVLGDRVRKPPHPPHLCCHGAGSASCWHAHAHGVFPRAHQLPAALPLLMHRPTCRATSSLGALRPRVARSAATSSLLRRYLLNSTQPKPHPPPQRPRV
jgi:hypothetical protein